MTKLDVSDISYFDVVCQGYKEANMRYVVYWEAGEYSDYSMGMLCAMDSKRKAKELSLVLNGVMAGVARLFEELGRYDFCPEVEEFVKDSLESTPHEWEWIKDLLIRRGYFGVDEIVFSVAPLSEDLCGKLVFIETDNRAGYHTPERTEP